MGDLDIGMAMVAARIASSEVGRGGTVRKSRDALSPGQNPPESRNPTLSGVKMEVIKGELLLIPSVELTRGKRASGWTLTRGDGSVVLIDTGEIVQSPKRKEEPRSSRQA
ncbi:MAG: hypothetical protein WCF31_03120 [Candidatus Deferrimicrobiaceae bacterium]